MQECDGDEYDTGTNFSVGQRAPPLLDDDPWNSAWSPSAALPDFEEDLEDNDADDASSDLDDDAPFPGWLDDDYEDIKGSGDFIAPAASSFASDASAISRSNERHNVRSGSTYGGG